MKSPTCSTNVFRMTNMRGFASPFRTAMPMLSLLIRSGLAYVAGRGTPSFVPIVGDGYAHSVHPLRDRHHARALGAILVGVLLAGVILSTGPVPSLASDESTGSVLGSMKSAAALFRVVIERSRQAPTAGGNPRGPSAGQADVPGTPMSESPRDFSGKAAARLARLTGVDEGLIHRTIGDLMNDFRRELVQEIRRELMNESHAARDTFPERRWDPAPSQAGVPGTIAALSPYETRAKGSGIDAAAVREAGRTRVTPTVQMVAYPQENPVRTHPGSKSPTLGRLDMLAVLVHPSNPVGDLTVDQVRKLYTGEYTNWNQVGGPDLAVKVFTARRSRGSGDDGIEEHLGSSLAAGAVRLPWVSYIVPCVSGCSGAIGLLPLSTMEQLEFVAGHSAFKRIAIRPEHGTPAGLPDRWAALTETYAIMKVKQSASQGR